MKLVSIGHGDSGSLDDPTRRPYVLSMSHSQSPPAPEAVRLRNRLAGEHSPYLLQHAENPVHWQPWDSRALLAARTLNRPILLSIGYAACHWCHVMAHESFEDDKVADLMNNAFVNIKVDREERPDIDHLYMAAIQAMGEAGGWPLTIFLTPEGRAFWGGTYFPPVAQWGRPSFSQILNGIAAAWAAGDGKVEANASAISEALLRVARSSFGDLPTPDAVASATAALASALDQDGGGLQGAPKFPNSPLFRFLWGRSIGARDRLGIDAVHLLLTKMISGGIHDHLGGGFARYSTDAEWLVPHFEKMLYDNAQILDLMALSAASGHLYAYRDAAEGIVRWLVRDMTVSGPRGGTAFAASVDADSDGVEGRYYVWSRHEVEAVLGTEAAAFCDAYDVTELGNWDGHTILRRMRPVGTDAEEALLARCRDRMLAVRAERRPPSRDDKVLADWNGLAAASLVRAAAAFDRPDWLQLAQSICVFVRSHMMQSDDRVGHAWRGGRLTAIGLLDDQAAMARAFLALHEATGDKRYLREAIALAEATERNFGDSDGSFFMTAIDAPDIPLHRPRSAIDGATPSGNGLMAEVLVRLFHLTGDMRWRERAERTICAFAGDRLVTAPTLLAASEMLRQGPTVVISGGTGDAAARLLAAALRSPDPGTVVLRATDDVPLTHPAHGHLTGLPQALICRGMVCSLPIGDPAALASRLRQGA